MNMGFQRDSVPLVGLGEAHYQSSRSDTFLSTPLFALLNDRGIPRSAERGQNFLFDIAGYVLKIPDWPLPIKKGLDKPRKIWYN